MMIKQFRIWYVIITKEKLTIKAHVLALWSDTPEAHVTTFVRQLDRHQVECKDHGVTVTKDDKVDHFVYQMYAFGLFEAKLWTNGHILPTIYGGVHNSTS